jgi:hypothetical protein
MRSWVNRRRRRAMTPSAYTSGSCVGLVLGRDDWSVGDSLRPHHLRTVLSLIPKSRAMRAIDSQTARRRAISARLHGALRAILCKFMRVSFVVLWWFGDCQNTSKGPGGQLYPLGTTSSAFTARSLESSRRTTRGDGLLLRSTLSPPLITTARGHCQRQQTCAQLLCIKALRHGRRRADDTHTSASLSSSRLA